MVNYYLGCFEVFLKFICSFVIIKIFIAIVIKEFVIVEAVFRLANLFVIKILIIIIEEFITSKKLLVSCNFSTYSPVVNYY